MIRPTLNSYEKECLLRIYQFISDRGYVVKFRRSPITRRIMGVWWNENEGKGIYAPSLSDLENLVFRSFNYMTLVA